MSEGRFSVEAAFKAIDQFSSVVSKIGSDTKKMMKSVGTSVTEMNAGVDKGIGALKAMAVAAAAAGAVAGAGLMHIVHAGADFEQSITNVGAVMGKNRGQIADLEKEAMRLGVVTQFSSSEVAEAMEMMAKKGFDSQEILQGIPGVLNAIAASGQGMAEVSTVVGSAIRGFGLEAKSASHVADLLAFAAEKTGATITDMGVALSNAAPTAKTLGVSIEDTAAAVGLMQKMGIDASTAGTAVATMLAKITKPSKDAAAQMAAMGIKFKDAKGNAIPFVDILGQFVKAGDKAGGNMNRMAFFAELVGLRGDKAAIALSDMAKSGDFQKLAQGLKTVDGYSQKVASIRLDTTMGSWKLFTSTIEVLETKLFNLKSGALRGVIDQTNAWVAANQDLIVQKVQDVIQSIADNMPKIMVWLERAEKFAAVWLAYAGAVKVAAAAQAILTAVTAASPITLWIVGITAAISLLVAFWPEISAFFSNVWNGIKSIAVAVASTVANAVQEAWGPVKAFLVGVGEFFVGLLTLLVAPFMPLLRPVFDYFEAAAGAIMDAWSSVSGFFGDIFGAAAKLIGKSIGQWTQMAKDAYATFKAVWAPLGTFFSDLWKGISDTFRSVLGWVIDKISAMVTAVRNIGAHTLGEDAPPGEDHGAGEYGPPPAPVPQVVPPRGVPAMGEQHAFYNTNESVDVNINAPRGAVEMPSRSTNSRVRLNLTPSGAFGYG